MGFHGSFMSILRNYQIKLGRSNVTARFGMLKLLMPFTFRLWFRHDDKEHKDCWENKTFERLFWEINGKYTIVLASRNNTTTLIRIFKRQARWLGKLRVFSKCTTHEIKLEASSKEEGSLIVDVIKRRVHLEVMSLWT